MDLVYDLSQTTTDSYRDYMLKIVSMIKREEVECILERKLFEARKQQPKVVRKNVDRGDVFTVRAYVLAPDIEVTSADGVPIPLRIVCNSAIHVDGDRMKIFLRLGSLACPPLGCWNCRTFLAYTELPLEEVRGRLKLKAKTLLYPVVSMECVEDPRIDPDDPTQLYHVRGHYRFWAIFNMRVYVLTFVAKVENGVAKTLEPVVFKDRDGTLFLFRDYRDTFALSKRAMATRPWIERLGTGAIFIGPREGLVVDFPEMKTYPELIPSSEELKTGGNCSVKLSSNEYLMIFHAVDNAFGCYYHYAAIFSDDGELLGVSPEPIIAPRPSLFTGTRPSTIFVNGAQIVKDKLIVCAGKDDEMLVLLEADLNKVIEKIKFVKG